MTTREATTAPVTAAEAARLITDEARRQGIPGPPFDGFDWNRLAIEVGWIVGPTPSSDVLVYSDETLEAEEELSALNERINETLAARSRAAQAGASGDDWTLYTDRHGAPVSKPRDTSRDAEVQELEQTTLALEHEHQVLAGRLTRLRKRDVRRHEKPGLVDRARALVGG